MIDYYFYFDRKDHQILIFNEDCYLRTRTILKTERILESVQKIIRNHKVNKVFVVVSLVVFVGTIAMFLYRKRSIIK